MVESELIKKKGTTMRYKGEKRGNEWKLPTIFIQSRAKKKFIAQMMNVDKKTGIRKNGVEKVNKV